MGEYFSVGVDRIDEVTPHVLDFRDDGDSIFFGRIERMLIEA